MTYRERAQDIYNKVFQGQLMEAFEQYYGENCVHEEPTGERREGKEAIRAAELRFLDSVQEWHGGGVTALTSDEENGITAVESWMEVTFKDGTRTKMEQIARQKWEGDHIVSERFYYNPGPQPAEGN